MFAKFLKARSGATAIEYTLLAALIGVALVAALQAVEADMTTTMGDVSTALQAN